AIAHTFHTKNIDAAIEHAKNMEHGTHGSAKLDKFRWKQVPTAASKANVIMIIPDKEAELDTQRWALHDPGPGGVYGIMEVEGGPIVEEKPLPWAGELVLYVMVHGEPDVVAPPMRDKRQAPVKETIEGIIQDGRA